MATCCGGKEADSNFTGDACTLLMSAFILAGLAMMLNIRLSYSSAPYALIRFRLPENLFSVFVRRMASALELWCLPSMLLGNIMDLAMKLIGENPELRAIKAEATDIKQKANDLKGTADRQSNEELTKTKDNDIHGDDQKGGELDDKANELKNKASLLSQEAGKLVAAASTPPLLQLRAPAETLKDKAKKTGGGDGLYKAAETLAGPGSGLELKATAVIFRFEAVQDAYKTLMEAAKRIQKESDTNVTAVTTEFDSLKKIYDVMLNLTKLVTKANTLKGTATIQSTSTELTEGSISAPATTLATLAQNLSTAAEGVTDDQLRTQAQLLATAAGTSGLQEKATELAGNPTNYTKATPVIEAFDNVKQEYDKLIKLAIENNKLSLVRNVETKFEELKKHYDGMMKFTKIKYYSGEIEKEAETLRNSGGTTEAEKIVRYFESMEIVYNQLTNNGSVKAKFEPLKTVYDPILNVTKIKQPATNLSNAAQKLNNTPTVATARAFKKKYDAFKEAYDSNKTAQSSLQSQWDDLKKIIPDSMKRWKFGWIIAPSIVTQWLNFLTYVLLLVVYLMGGESGHLTLFYFVIAISGVVFGINMTLVYSVDFYYIPVYIVGENCFPAITSFMHYISTLMFGNRRKWNSDFLLVKIDICVAIIISFVAAIVWTYGYLCEITGGIGQMKHIHANKFDGNFHWEQISPFLMIVVGMGLVFTIYPGIAPGMIVPFYLVDKIEMVLLIATIFPPVIIAILRLKAKEWSPQHHVWQHGGFERWRPYKKHVQGSGGGPLGLCDKSKETEDVHAWIWHLFDLLMVTKISLAAIFIYSLHYRDSHISRSIINQPKMSTLLSITYYMCHEILLAVGFSGFIGNDGGDLILIPQYIGALFMIFLAFYSEGYIIEYKSHDPAH